MAEPPSETALIVLVILTLVAAGGLAGFAYYHSRPGNAPSVLHAQPGGNATVNYIGYFGSGPESGRVFDTSIYAVATNNATYPKSIEFHLRGSASSYTPLGVHLGTGGPSGGYTIGNTTFVTVVTGFWQGLLGVPGNTTKTVVVPPSLGYGAPNPACYRTLPMSYTVPVVATFSSSGFASAYPNVSPVTGVTFQDPHYGWNVTVLAANSSFVTIENLPYVGYAAHPAGWPVVVTAIAATSNGAGAITLVNQLVPSDAGHLVGKDFNGTGPCSSTSNAQFIVTAVDPTAGTYTEDFNQEVQGQILIFVITIIDIFPPPAPTTV
jgi:FKBP-type peptidyl-prolyl cis-trans isomerase 2